MRGARDRVNVMESTGTGICAAAATDPAGIPDGECFVKIL
jgi:hypothetical protein